MSKAYERYQKRRLISSYFSVVLSIALVLFLLGLFGVLLVNTQKLANLFKEQMAITVYLKDTAKEIEVDQLQKHLALAEYTK
ncbi:MAG: ABC transporter permease, partial [Flavobacteriaceae bacterium]|nr:ABC transporter permease [Flavobacteriaceae bacterium]